MFQRPSFSHRGSVAGTRDSLHVDTIPSQPRYVRDKNGLLKYVVDIDLSGVPRRNLQISAKHQVVLITAKYEQIAENGDRTTHEVVREIHVPLSVDLSTVQYYYSDSGMLTIEAEATDPLPSVINRHLRCQQARTRSPPRTNFQPDLRRVTFMEPQNSTLTSNDKFGQYLAPMRHLISPPPQLRPPPNIAGQKNVFPARGHSMEPITAHNPATKLFTSTKIPERMHARNYRVAGPTSPPASPRLFRLRVDIGSSVEPNELSIVRQNGVLLVHARRYAKKTGFARQRDHLIFEHRSEHTLPNNVDVNRLSARLENTTVYIDAPYLKQIQSPTIGTPTLIRHDSKASDLASNWPTMKPR